MALRRYDHFLTGMLDNFVVREFESPKVEWQKVHLFAIPPWVIPQNQETTNRQHPELNNSLVVFQRKVYQFQTIALCIAPSEQGFA